MLWTQIKSINVQPLLLILYHLKNSLYILPWDPIIWANMAFPFVHITVLQNFLAVQNIFLSAVTWLEGLTYYEVDPVGTRQTSVSPLDRHLPWRQQLTVSRYWTVGPAARLKFNVALSPENQPLPNEGHIILLVINTHFPRPYPKLLNLTLSKTLSSDLFMVEDANI